MALLEQQVPFEVNPPVEDAAHIAAMVAKADGTTTPATETPNAGEEKLLAGKYKTQEDLEKGYLELQKMLGQKETPAAEAPASDVEGKEKPLEIPKEVKEGDATPEAAKEALEAKGLDLTVFNTEYAEKGELTPASYEALEKAGIPKAVVDSYIEGQKLVVERMQNSVFDSVGGSDEYQELMLWAKDNLDANAKAAYQAALDTNDVNRIILAAKGLKADYVAVKGQAPQLLTQTETASTTSNTYQSRAQMSADMRDPRYAKDPAFRQSVAEKLARSTFM